MSHVLVIVTGVLVHQALQMLFIENDRMVEQIAAAVADPALGNTVLSQAMGSSAFVPPTAIG
jgi:hypothetical protein